MAAADKDAVADERRVALVRARLAAEERDALEAIKGDLCQWLANPDVLALDIAPASFLRVLDSGVSLCKLAGLVQEGATRCLASGEKLSVRVPMAPLTYKSIKSPPGSAMFQACARDNASHFIQWCRALGVDEAVIFESVGLVEHRDEKRVILCLLDVARFAEKVGITPPQLVSLEKEIDLLEAQSLDPVEREDDITSNKTELSLPEKEDMEIKPSSNQPKDEEAEEEREIETEAEEEREIETEAEEEREIESEAGEEREIESEAGEEREIDTETGEEREIESEAGEEREIETETGEEREIDTETGEEREMAEAGEEREMETETEEEKKTNRKRYRDLDKKTNEEGNSEMVESPPNKRSKRGSHSEPAPPPQQPPPGPQSQSKQPTHHRRSVKSKKQIPTLSPSKKVDEKVDQHIYIMINTHFFSFR